jgi:hypothetical protein
MVSDLNRTNITDAPQLSRDVLTASQGLTGATLFNRTRLQQSPPSQFPLSVFGTKSIEPQPSLPDELQAFVEQGHDPSCLLIADEVAKILRVSERWVRDHTTRRSPRIRAVNLGSLVRYRLSDVAKFLIERDAEACSKETKHNRARKAA